MIVRSIAKSIERARDDRHVVLKLAEDIDAAGPNRSGFFITHHDGRPLIVVWVVSSLVLQAKAMPGLMGDHITERRRGAVVGR